MKVTSRISFLLVLSVIYPAYAEERAYSIIDAQGRVQTIKSDVSPTTVKKIESAITPKIPKPTTTKDAFRSLDDEIYVDSDYLEKRDFNLEDKKRFYYVPNGTLGQQVIESDNNTASAVSIDVTKTKQQRREAFYADSYQILSTKMINTYAPAVIQFCKETKKLKKYLRPLKETNALWLGSDDVMPQDIDRALFLPKTSLTETRLRISSYATTNKTPKFYVPIVSFLDVQGCFLSGAWQYWSRAYPATEHQFAAVEGILDMPKNTKFVVFSRPVSELSVGLPQQQSGSLVIENE